MAIDTFHQNVHEWMPVVVLSLEGKLKCRVEFIEFLEKLQSTRLISTDGHCVTVISVVEFWKVFVLDLCITETNENVCQNRTEW